MILLWSQQSLKVMTKALLLNNLFHAWDKRHLICSLLWSLNKLLHVLLTTEAAVSCCCFCPFLECGTYNDIGITEPSLCCILVLFIMKE